MSFSFKEQTEMTPALSKTFFSVFQRPVRLLGALFIALAFFSLAGGPLAVVQTVAWATMIRNYSATESLATAVEKTFSGKYPCALCQKIAVAKKEEKQKQTFLETIAKKEKIASRELPLLEPLFFKKISYPDIGENYYCGFRTKPATPPPRGA